MSLRYCVAMLAAWTAATVAFATFCAVRMFGSMHY